MDTSGWITFFRSGLWRLYYKLSTEGRRRYFDEFLPLLGYTKADILGEREADSYYLVYLGTKKFAQGHGYASKLIEQMSVKVSIMLFIFFFPLAS
jgi:hypothetical protein